MALQVQALITLLSVFRKHPAWLPMVWSAVPPNANWTLLRAVQGGQSHSITSATDRNYLWAQKNPDIVKLVGNSGCSLVAVLNTANIYGPREFTPNEVLTACGNWGANGLNTWALPSKCNGKIDTSNYTHGGKEQATVFSAVKASIDNNLPIIIRLNSSEWQKDAFCHSDCLYWQLLLCKQHFRHWSCWWCHSNSWGSGNCTQWNRIRWLYRNRSSLLNISTLFINNKL